jgi:tape measure domain-containing protein
MNLLPDLKANLTLDDSGFTLTAERAGRVLGTLSRQFEDSAIRARRTEAAIQRIGSSFRSTIVTLGALRFAFMDVNDFLLSFPRSIARTAGEFQRLQLLMAGLSKSSDEAVKSAQGLTDLGRVIEFARNAPFEIGALADAFVKLKSGGIDPTNGSMNALVNSVAKFGGSSETLKRAAIAIQQMSGKGVISMEELRQQLGEAVPNAMELMARGMGLSMAELTEKVSKGIVKSQQALAKMFAQMELDANGAAARMMESFPGALARLKTDYELFQKTIADQGFMTALTAAMREISQFFGSSEGQTFAKSIGNSLREATEALVVMSRWLIQNADLMKSIGIALLSVFGGSKLAGAIQGITGRMAEMRMESQRMAAEARENIQKNIDALRAESQARAQSMADAISAGKREQAEFQKANQSKIDGWARLRNAKTAAMQREIAELQTLEAKRAEIDKKALDRVLTADQTGSYAQGRPMAGPGAIQQTVALQEEARALKEARDEVDRKIEAHTRHIQSYQSSIAAAGDKINQLGREGAAYTGVNNAIQRTVDINRAAIQENNKKIESLRGIANAAATTGSAIMNFGKTLGASLVYAGAFYLAIEGLVWIYNRLTKAAREAEEAQLRAERVRNKQSTAEDKAAIEKQLSDLTAEREALEKRRETLRSAIANAAGKDSRQEIFRGELAKVDAKLENISRRARSLVPQLAEATKQVDRANAEQVSRSILTDLEAQLSEQVSGSGIFKRYDELKEQQAQAIYEGNKTRAADLDKQMKSLGEQLKATELKIYKDLSDKQLTEMSGADGRTIDAVKKGIREKTDSLAKALRDIRDKDQFLTSTKGGSGSQGDSAFKNFIQAQTDESMKLKGNAEMYRDRVITAGEIMKNARDRVVSMSQTGQLFQYEGTGKDKKKRALNQAEINQAADLLAENDLAKMIQDARNKVLPLLNQLEADEERVAEVFSGERLSKRGGGANQVDRMLARLQPLAGELSKEFKVELDKAGGSWEAFVSRMRNAAGNLRLAELMQGARDDIERMRTELIVDDDERQRAQMDRQIERVQQVLGAEEAAFARRNDIGQEDLRWISTRSTAEQEAFAIRNGIAIQDLQNMIRVRLAMGEQIALMRQLVEFNLRGPIARMVEQWSQGMKSMKQAAVGWAETFVDRLVEGNLKFGEFVEGILKDIAKIKIKEMLSDSVGAVLEAGVDAIGELIGLKPSAKTGQQQPKFDAAGRMLVNTGVPTELGPTAPGPDGQSGGMWKEIKDGFMKLWDNLKVVFDDVGKWLSQTFDDIMGAFSGEGGSNFLSEIGTAIAGFFGFANGGIMTAMGPVPLRKYAKGGIAKSPQLAMFGEGSRPEAFVPLPDGRSIPVTMSAGAQQPPAVTFNVVNNSGTPVTARQTGQKFDGRQMVLDIVLEGMSQPGSFRDSMRNVADMNK